MAMRDEIRTFHLTGQGLDEYLPKTSLAPKGVATGVPPPVNSQPLAEIHSRLLAASRGAARERYLENVTHFRDRLRELLTLDDSRAPDAVSADSLAAALGNGVASFLDTGILASAFRRPSNAVERMPARRRERIEGALKTLEAAVHEAATQPPFWLFPVADANVIEFCRKQLAKLTETLRAVRTARLEVESAYQPDLHDDWLQRFDWESADAEELAALPAIVVTETADHLATTSLTGFGTLLRSGLPLQILVSCPGCYTGDLGYLAIAYREAFVLQSSIACPEHMNAGLADMTRTMRPAVAVVSVLGQPLFVESRTFPLFVYDPDHGDSWADRFQLHTPATAAAINTVHFAATQVDFHRQFRVIPETAWDGEQMELGEYLYKYTKVPPMAIPYLWVAAGDGIEERAIVARDLVNLARDRRRAWKTFEELAGIGKAPSAAPDADRELAAREQGAREAVYKVVAMLTGAVVIPDAPAVPAPQPAPVAVSASAEPATPTAAVELSTEPYVDSFLCTSCNDCRKINSRMFQYNANQQVFLADASLGTYAEIVKAAEGCPSRCIHPGAPRPGDATATPKIIARAEKFR